MSYKQTKALVVSGICAVLLCGCDGNAQTQSANNDTHADVIAYDADDWFQEYDLADVTVIDLDEQSENMTIKEAGTYLLQGTLNGNIEINVNKEDTVRLILNNVTIHSETTAAISCDQAKKLILSMPEGTINTISDGESYADQSENASDATIFVQDDLSINGTGTLIVNAQYRDAIKAKDTLKLMEGNYTIQAKEDGIIGRDYLYVHSGNYTIETAQDGLKTTYDTDTAKGDMIIENGTFQIIAANDGIQSEHNVTIYDGNFTIQTAEGSGDKAINTNTFTPDPNHRFDPQNKRNNQSEDTPSAKGIKSGGDMFIYGGIYDLNTSDDALHTNADLYVGDGHFTIACGDDGMHSDGTLTIDDGSIDITNSYEGVEGSKVIIHGGYLTIVSTDDGINAAGGSDDDMTQEDWDRFNEGDHTIAIHGGAMIVDAQGDGLDSNGSITMDGGSVVIYGPENGANGALDCESGFVMNGGILIAMGSSQMAMAPTQDSAQYTWMANLSSQESHSIAYISDAQGNAIIGFTSSRAYDNVVISVPELTKGETYQLYVNASGGNVNDNGYIESGLNGGTLAESITITQSVTTTGNTANQFNMNQNGDMRRPDDMHEQGNPPQEPPQMGEKPQREPRQDEITKNE